MLLRRFEVGGRKPEVGGRRSELGGEAYRITHKTSHANVGNPSDFRLQTSDFRHPTSDFSPPSYHNYTVPSHQNELLVFSTAILILIHVVRKFKTN